MHPLQNWGSLSRKRWLMERVFQYLNRHFRPTVAEDLAAALLTDA